MPVQNGDDHLREALASLLAQEFQDFSIYISDNVSNDQTEDICRQFERSDTRVHYERRSSEVSAATNFFDLVNKCESEYFMWAAHDDMWSHNWLLSLVKVLGKQDKASGAFGVLRHVNCGGQEMTTHPANGLTSEKWDSLSRTKRFFSYLQSNPGKGKANLFYSLFRTEAIKKAVARAQQHRVDFDCAILSGLLWEGNIASTTSATFSKRICSRLSKDAGEASTNRNNVILGIDLPLRIKRRMRRALESHNELLQYLSMARGFYARLLTLTFYFGQLLVIMFHFFNIIADLKSLYDNRKA
jgi:glycosyltransferase involved in cell wall biosynthesis